MADRFECSFLNSSIVRYIETSHDQLQTSVKHFQSSVPVISKSHWQIQGRVPKGSRPHLIFWKYHIFFELRATIIFAEFNIHSQAGPSLAEGLDLPLKVIFSEPVIRMII